jgi:hypothetical protein
LRAPIVSSRQVEEFAEWDTGAGPVSLPSRIEVFDVYEAAGHRTVIQRQLTIDRYLLNTPDFADRVAAAHGSANVMLRETPDGLRYLVRRSDGDRQVLADASPPIRAAVLGLVIDPNITRPLPFAGLSYLDLDWLGRGQLNAFVGGTYGQLSWSLRLPRASEWMVEGSAFAIAVPYNDRVFRGGREQYAENLQQLPMRAMAGVAGPLTPGVRASTSYTFDVTRFDRASTTAGDFAIPATAIVHGAIVALHASRGPWSGRVWWNPAWRQGWAPWGITGSADTPTVRSFQRWGVRAARTVTLGRRINAAVSADGTSGQRLDRFSRFAVDGFENRIHGYPTASIRYDRGVTVRSTVGWAGHGWRLNGFADVAAVRDTGFGNQTRVYPGFGASIEAGGPLRTLWSVEWGYGPRAIAADGGVGTQAWRITGYRPF